MIFTYLYSDPHNVKFIFGGVWLYPLYWGDSEMHFFDAATLAEGDFSDGSGERDDGPDAELDMVDAISEGELRRIIGCERTLIGRWFIGSCVRRSIEGDVRRGSGCFEWIAEFEGSDFGVLCGDFFEESGCGIGGIIPKTVAFSGSSDEEIPFGTSHRDVHEASFFFDLFRLHECACMREESLLCSGDDNILELESLGKMDRHE